MEEQEKQQMPAQTDEGVASQDVAADKADDERGSRKRLVGLVVSDTQDKTIVVSVERRIPHPLYHKVMKRKKRFYAHDQDNEASVGDKVLIEETRPLSKLKRWRLTSIIQRAALP